MLRNSLVGHKIMKHSTHFVQLLVGCAIGILLGACHEPLPSENLPGVAHADGIARTSIVPTEGRREEAYLADIERSAPGFGGYFADKTGVLHVWVKSTDQAAAATTAVRAQFSSGRMLGSADRIPSVVVERGKFAFSQLSSWRESIFDYAVQSGNSGIRALDVDEARNRIRVDVEGSIFQVQKAIAGLGVDTTALIFEVFSPMKEASRSTPANINSVASPLVGGVGIFWSSGTDAGLCTTGFLARYNGVAHFVTAAHCTGMKYALDGASIRQPAYFDSPIVGTEISDPPGYTCGIYICRGSDAALFSLASGVTGEVGLLARTQVRNGGGATGASTTIAWDQANPYWIVDAVEQDNLYVGAPVDKVGLTSGWTWGLITGTCVDYLPSGGAPVKQVRCVYQADVKIEGGDSGGPVFYVHAEGDSRVTLAGTVIGIWNGQMAFSKYWRIASDLGGGLDARRAITLSTPVITGILQGQAPTVTWSAISGATYYRVYRQWYRYSTGTGSNGWELFMDGTNAFTDPNLISDAYTGTTTPNFSTEGYIKYQIRPMSATESGSTSNTINFRLAP